MTAGRRLAVCALAVAGGAIAGGASAAQDAPPPVFGETVFGETVDVRVVNVEVVVTDGEGRRVPGLGRDDFRLTVDGEEVAIDYFTEVRAGVVAGGAGKHSCWLPTVATVSMNVMRRIERRDGTPLRSVYDVQRA